METIKKFKWALITIAVILIGVVSIFYLMYQKDMATLKGFTVSYQQFDKTMSDFSTSDYEEVEHEAVIALIDLTKKAIAFRVSSLIKNDPQLITAVHEIGILAGKEMDALKASKVTHTDATEKTYHVAREQRKATYEYMIGLGK